MSLYVHSRINSSIISNWLNRPAISCYWLIDSTMYVLIKILSPNPLDTDMYVCTYIRCLVVFFHQYHTLAFKLIRTNSQLWIHHHYKLVVQCTTIVAFQMPSALNLMPPQLHGGALAAMTSALCIEHVTSSPHAWHFCQRCESWSTCPHHDLSTTHHISCM